MTNMDIAKQQVKLLNIIPGQQTVKGDWTFINPCPICGHKDHFAIKKERYYSFSSCCSGGTILDYIIESKNLTIKEARKELLSIAGIENNPIDNKQLIKMKEKRDKEKKIKEKKELIIKKCYCKLTNFERLLRSFENKNFLENSLLTFIDNYTTRFIKTTDVNSLYSLCMNFKEEFDQWYKNYCWVEERRLNNEN